VHQEVPPRGYIGVFNRSHYEDVLIARVKGLVPEETWRARYEQIAAFEKLLSAEGTRILKFYLHVTKAYQKERLQGRLDDPAKRWKFSPADLPERARWKDYMAAYEEAFHRCSTAHAPWFIVPAEKRWYRNLVVTKVLVDALESMAPRYPEPDYDYRKIVIPD
jgi:polyphosphate kinase 2 (PPK2 family)